jgi:hypothetical protein
MSQRHSNRVPKITQCRYALPNINREDRAVPCFVLVHLNECWGWLLTACNMCSRCTSQLIASFPTLTQLDDRQALLSAQIVVKAWNLKGLGS